MKDESITGELPSSAGSAMPPTAGAAVPSPSPDLRTVITADGLARLFHETYEKLAPGYGYKTRVESAVAWDDVPYRNRSLMLDVAWRVICNLNDRLADSNGAGPETTEAPASTGGVDHGRHERSAAEGSTVTPAEDSSEGGRGVTPSGLSEAVCATCGEAIVSNHVRYLDGEGRQSHLTCDPPAADVDARADSLLALDFLRRDLEEHHVCNWCGVKLTHADSPNAHWCGADCVDEARAYVAARTVFHESPHGTYDDSVVSRTQQPHVTDEQRQQQAEEWVAKAFGDEPGEDGGEVRVSAPQGRSDPERTRVSSPDVPTDYRGRTRERIVAEYVYASLVHYFGTGWHDEPTKEARLAVIEEGLGSGLYQTQKMAAPSARAAGAWDRPFSESFAFEQLSGELEQIEADNQRLRTHIVQLQEHTSMHALPACIHSGFEQDCPSCWAGMLWRWTRAVLQGDPAVSTESHDHVHSWTEDANGPVCGICGERG